MLLDTQGDRDRLGDATLVRERRQIDEPDAVRLFVEPSLRELERESRLATAPDPCEG